MHRNYKIALATLALLAIALLALSPDSPLRPLPFNDTPKIDRPPIETKRPNPGIVKIGHRGTTMFGPENTLPALEKAIELGLEYVEIDVRYTRNGVPVLMHDATLDRTTNGAGKVDEATLSELKQLDAGYWFEDEFIGTRVPTLEEALIALRGRACIFWDTKVNTDAALLAATIELFKRYGYDRNCLLIRSGALGSDADPTMPRQITKLWPDAPLVPIVKSPEEISAILSRFPNIRAVTVFRNKATPELVDAAHAEGLLVMTTTLGQADHPRVYQAMIEVGVDLLMLDHIDSFYTYLETGNIDTPPSEIPKNAEYLQAD